MRSFWRFVEKGAFYGVVGGIRCLPLRVAWWVGVGVGDLLRMFWRQRRRVAEENLQRAFPERSLSERRRLLVEHFRHLGVNLVELVRFPWAWRRLLEGVTFIGRESLEAAQSAGKGIVVFIAHTGNWEVLAPLWPLLYPRSMVVVQPLPNPWLDRFVSRCRSVTGLELVPRTGSLRRLVAGLKNGFAVGLLADQDAGPHGIFVSFFGELASCEPSPVVLARRLGCPLLLCLAFRNADNTHRVVFETIPENEDDAARLAFVYKRLEAHIRENPSQWLWIHRRWKTRPPGSVSSP